MFFKKIAVISVLSIASLFTHQSYASVVDAGWQSFVFGAIDANQTLFNETISKATTFTLTDGYLYGDWFNVYDNGTFLGSTSFAATTGPTVGAATTGPTAIANTNYSHGTFSLAAGVNNISIIKTQSPIGFPNGGTAFFNVVTAVPEPGEWALMLAGLSLVSWKLRNKKVAHVA